MTRTAAHPDLLTRLLHRLEPPTRARRAVETGVAQDPAGTPRPSADPAVIGPARRGSADARAALVRDLQDVWFRYALSMLRDVDQARDAAQETAMRFLRDLATFRGESTLRTWSLGIATNVCRERRRKRQHASLDHADPRVNPDTAPGPAQHAERREQRDRLLAVLADLPDRQREAVVLRYLEQLSVRDAAAAMGCAEGTVKATLSHALRSLRQMLGVHDG